MTVKPILGLLAKGMSVEQIAKSHPVLTAAGVRTALARAQQALRNDIVVDLARWRALQPPLLAESTSRSRSAGSRRCRHLLHPGVRHLSGSVPPCGILSTTRAGGPVPEPRGTDSAMRGGAP